LQAGTTGDENHFERRACRGPIQAGTAGGIGTGSSRRRDGEETAMMGELIRRNLLHRPLRTSIGVLAVGVEVGLGVLIVGLTSGLLTETAKRIEGIGADIILQPPAASIFLNFSGSPMPLKIGDKLGELKYVQAVSPALLQFNSTGGVDTIWGIDRESFR